MSNNHDLLNDNDMYFFSAYETDDMCFNNDIAVCGDGMSFVQTSRGEASCECEAGYG